MRFKIMLFCVALGLPDPFRNSFAGDVANNQKLVHNWDYLYFSDPTFFIHCGEPQPGCRFGLQLCVETHLDAEFFKTNHITARFYQENGTILEPADEDKKDLNLPMDGGTASASTYLSPPQTMTFLPWGTNALQEGWIEVSIGSERYWLEIPYGLGRNPEDPLPPSTPTGSTRSMPAMHSGDHIVRWEAVQYNLGKIQNDWSMILNLSNPADAEMEVRLYKDPDEAIKSPWTTNSPHTTARIVEPDGTVLDGQYLNTRIEGGRFWRTDSFRFGHYENNMRSWGRIEISVDDKTHRVVVPSSLYKYTHGHAS